MEKEEEEKKQSEEEREEKRVGAVTVVFLFHSMPCPRDSLIADDVH